MITIYHVGSETTPAYQPARRISGDGFWIWREQRRYEFMAAKLREAGKADYADLCDRWAEQARLEAASLEAADRRVAALDATLKGGAA